MEQAAPLEGGGSAGSTGDLLQSEAPDTLMEALRRASVVAEHRTLMGVVMEEVQSAKSGLNEAFCSLLAGFEVCDVMF